MLARGEANLMVKVRVVAQRTLLTVSTSPASTAVLVYGGTDLPSRYASNSAPVSATYHVQESQSASEGSGRSFRVL